mgnify:CR=1 FL=1
MRVKYYAAEGEARVWESESREVFRNLEGLRHYKEGVYFYPSEPEEAVWLWMVGHEKADPQKLVEGRMWRSRWLLHICVGGKGFYNGQPVQRGTAFVSWPHLAHSMRPDPDDPFEFYWIMIRGRDVLPYVREFGFRSGELIFDCPYMNELVPLLHVILHNDYARTDIKEFNTSMSRILLSYHRFNRQNLLEIRSSGECYANYVDSAKNLLYDHNYTLSVKQLSDMLGITPKHLCRVFLKTVGESPKQYMMRKRLEMSVDLLKGGMLPTEVAFMLKYADYASFYRAFLQKYGVSPSRYLGHAD